MAYPNYQNAKTDIEELISMMSRLNPFAVLEDEVLADEDVKIIKNKYEAMQKSLKDLISDKTNQEKENAWLAFNSEINAFKNTPFGETVDEQTKKLESSAVELTKWQFVQVLINLEGQSKIMEQRNSIKTLDESRTQAFLEAYDEYVNKSKEIDESYAAFPTWEDFENKVNEAGLKKTEAEEKEKNTDEAEQKAKKEYEDHHNRKYPDTLLTATKQIKLGDDDVAGEHTIAEVYEYYANDVKVKDDLYKAKEQAVKDYVNELKILFEKSKQKEIETLVNNLNKYVPRTEAMTEDVIKTMDLANAESKIFGDNYEISQYFTKLLNDFNRTEQTALYKFSDNVVGRALLSGVSFMSKNAKKAVNSMDLKVDSKIYLDRLIAYDNYTKGIDKLNSKCSEMEKKYTGDGMSLDDVIALGRQIAKGGQSDAVVPGSKEASGLEAYNQFELMKSEYITLMTAYAETKGFANEIKQIESIEDFLSRGEDYIKIFYNNYLAKGLYVPDGKKSLTPEMIETNKKCEEITKNYLQKIESKKIIERTRAKIKELNEEKIDTALTDIYQNKQQFLDACKKYKINTDRLEQLIGERDKVLSDKSISSQKVVKYQNDYNAYKEAEKVRDAWIAKDKELEQKYSVAAAAHQAAVNDLKIAKENSDKINLQYKTTLELGTKYKILKAEKMEIISNVYADKNNQSSNACRESINSIITNLKHFKNTAGVGRNSIFDDSNEYTNMITAVTEMLKPEKAGEKEGSALFKKTLSEVQAGLEKIASAAQAYIDAKNKQFRLFPSTQRRTRLAYANNLKDFANIRFAHVAAIDNQMTGIRPKFKEEFDRVSDELGKDAGDMESFVSKILYPKAKGIAEQKAREKEQQKIINVDESKLSPQQLINKEGLNVEIKPQPAPKKIGLDPALANLMPEDPNLGQKMPQ